MDSAKSTELATRIAIAVALAALVGWSFWSRYSMLTSTPFPVGIDGYFYPIQLRSLLEHGSLAYPASPLAFWLMAPLAALTDPMTGAKLGAALYGALIALPMYAVGTRLGKHRGAGLVAAALAVTSAGSAFLTMEFVKNGIGLTVGVTALWLVLRALETRTRVRIAVALGGVLAAYLTHKMAAAIVLSITIPAALAEAAAHGVLRGRRLFYTLGGLGAAVIVLAILGAVFPERFVSAGDASLLGSLLGAAHWGLPALATPNVELTMGHEASIGLVLAIAAGATLVSPLRHQLEKLAAGEAMAARVIVGLALVIALPWLAVDNPQGLGFRVRIIAFVPMALCAAIVARGTLRWLAKPRAVIAGGALALVIAGAMPRERTQGRILAHPAMVAAVEGLAGKLPPGSIAIVPERHIAFMVTWYTRVPHRQRPDDVPREHRYRVMPLAFVGAGSPLDELLMLARKQPGLAPPIGTHPRHPNGLVVVPEATWEWIVDRLPPAARDHFLAWPTI